MHRHLAAALLLLPGPALAADAAGTAPGTVTTHATARGRLPNTVADVVLGIEAHARTLNEVQAALSAGSVRLTAYLKTAGAEQARTQDVTVQPDLDPDPVRGQQPRILGYAGRLTVAFQVEAGTLGTVLTGALGQGANAIDQTMLHPRAVEIDTHRASLATDATRVALDQARAVATAAGRQLGAVRVLTVDPQPGATPRPLMMRSAVQGAAPIATEAGDSEVTATVSVTMALIEP